jgi:ParB family chromosome partitioning protein
MKEVKLVSPFRCRMWDRHERLEGSISEESCRDEIESVSKHGQLLPVLGRPIRNDPTHDIELVYGARRLFVARYLNLPLLIEIKEISDREAIVALDIENRLRKELSPYEQGRSFQVWLRSGIFASQGDLAREIGISASQVSRLLKLAQLPTVLISAFASPTDICENWGRDLTELWMQKHSRDNVVRAARSIAIETPRPEALSVLQRLLASQGGYIRSKVTKGKAHDEVVKDKDGRILFRICIRRKSIAFMLPTEHVSSTIMADIKVGLSTILHRARAQVSNGQGECQSKHVKSRTQIADASIAP